MYWKYAGTQYKSKFAAIDAAGSKLDQITFHAFDESFKDFDYSVEPLESHEQLLKERCLEIRDNYSYIKLFFSGGSDSTTVLNTFIKNDIPIDEIIIYRYSLDDDIFNPSNDEVNKYTIPFSKTLNTKVKVYDFKYDHFSSLLKNDNWFSKRNTLALRETDIPNIRGKNFCNLFCTPDPTIKYIDGSWHLVGWDTDVFTDLAKFRNVEHFFLSSKLLAKEGHMLKNYCKNKKVNYSKQLLRDLLRHKPVAKEQIFKSDIEDHGLIVNPAVINGKERLLLKNASQETKDKYRYILSTPINNMPLVRLIRGYEFYKFNLGD